MKMFAQAGVLVALLAVASVTARPSGDEPKKDEAPRFTRTTSYHGANTRLDHTVDTDDIGLEYYGGARGMVLSYHPVLGLTPSASNLRKEDEEDVGQETEPPQKPPVSGGGDSVTISKPPPGASIAEARPVGLAIAGVGGTASSQPVGTAVVGPAGLAISRPVATAIAGVQLGDQVLAGVTGMKPSSYSGVGTRESPVVVAYAPGESQNYFYQSASPIQPEPMSPLRGNIYGSNRPDSAPVNRPQASPYPKPSGDRGPMYGYKPPRSDVPEKSVQPLALTNVQSPFYTTGIQYGYPDFPIDVSHNGNQVLGTPAQAFAYRTLSNQVETAKDPAVSLAVGPGQEGGKYSIVPLGRTGEENKIIPTTYQVVSAGQHPVVYSQYLYPLAVHQ